MKALHWYLWFCALVLGILIGLGIYHVHINRTSDVPKVTLHSPITGDLPEPNQVVEMRYPWGCCYARYLKGDANRRDIWLKYEYLEDGYIAALDLYELYGLPIYWWTPPSIPDGYRSNILERVEAP